MESARPLCDDWSTMSTTRPTDVRRATRDTQDYIVGGVASGLAAHLALPVAWVRAAFVLLAVIGGVGVGLYAGFWMVLPADSRFDDQAPGLASATRTGKRPGRARRLVDVGPAVALGALGLGLIFMIEALFGRAALFWPVLLGVIGVTLLWRQADEAQRERWLDGTSGLDPIRAVFGSGGWASYARVGAGLVLIFGALLVFSLQAGELSVARDVLLATGLGIAGLAISVGPWIFRMASDLTSERAERVRSQERADMAAHLHDSVLQTLALIQKNAGDGPTVARLARAQERDLRAWLYAEESTDATTLASALRAVAAEVEDGHGVKVQVVTVGDRPSSETLRPLVNATREAVTNSAKHAGTDLVDLYVEVSPMAADVFVRDRGVGFSLDSVADDRFGVRRSIIDRMERHGGTAEVRSAPGEGTEVRLHMPLDGESND